MRGNKSQRTHKKLVLESLESRMMYHAAGMLSGAVFFDADNDGMRDATEIGVPGIVIRLTETGSAASAVDRSTITNQDGEYVFDELDEGTYQISKRPSPALINGSTTIGVNASEELTDVVLVDDAELDGNDFNEQSLRPEFLGIQWFFASSPSETEMLREAIALGEELGGDSDLAESIRAGGTDVPNESDNTPVAANDAYSVGENQVLTATVALGILSNDVDLDGDSLTATLVNPPSNGDVTFNADGSFAYTPDNDFTGADSFTYTASDGVNTSNVATVTISVTAVIANNEPFGAVTQGLFDDAGLLGTRTDLVTGAPPVTNSHLDGDIDYAAYSNPPTYGDHHGSDSLGTDVNPGITPRPTGVYTTEQPDEDLVHNLEHGHVWISYNPSLISANDRTALEQLVRDGTTNSNGSGVGVILTPRAANDHMIALASWAHLLTLDNYDPSTIRDFVETNRGKAPEGFITP